MPTSTSSSIFTIKSNPWIFALKPASWPKLLLPAFWGQALAFFAFRNFSLSGAILGLLISIADLIFIVLLNDWGDQHVDRVKRTLFPKGGGIKTIPDGILPAHRLLQNSCGIGLFGFLLSLLGGWYFQRPFLAGFYVAAVCIYLSYTFPPLKLNYRGGGEILEMFGVGFFLPWLNAYSQSGVVWHPFFIFAFAFLPSAFASALASGLSDEESDRVGGKCTFTTALGNQKVKKLIHFFMLLQPLFWVCLGEVNRSDFSIYYLLIPALCFYFFFYRMLDTSTRANTRQFSELSIYKKQLHYAIWTSQSVLTFTLLAFSSK